MAAPHYAYYEEVLKKLCEKLTRQRPDFFRNAWILDHDNATAHTALSEYAPYSLHLLACYFYFARDKKNLEKHVLVDSAATKSIMPATLKAVSKLLRRLH